MNKLGRLLNEVSVALSREYLPFRTRVRVLLSYYLMVLRCRLSRKSGGTVKFMQFELYSPSFTNLITIVREVFLFGDYYFKADSKEPTIVDCGGNIGIATVFFKWLYPKARITVWEPAPQNLDALKRNISLNHFADVSVIEAAAGRTEGTATFYQSETRPGSSTLITAVHDTKAKSGKHRFLSYDVSVRKMSSVLGEQVDFLKMDIEGGEGDVLRDLSENNTLGRIKDMVFEYHDNKENVSNKLVDVVTLLEESGMRVTIFNNEITESSEVLTRLPSHHFLIRASR